MQTETIQDWRADLRAGTIVAFAFPSSEGDPALEKHRPSLVLDVHPEDGEATVVYGTGAWTRANTGQELRIADPADLAEASLRRPTRFVGARHVRVPLDSPRFVTCAAGTAVLGHLPAALMPRLDRIRNTTPRVETRRRRTPRGPFGRPRQRPAGRHPSSEKDTA